MGTGARGGAGSVVGRPEVAARWPHLASVWRQADALFPVRITRSFWERFAGDGPDGALAKQVLPAAEELAAHSEDRVDPVGEQGRSPVPWVVQKYDDRVLLLMTKRCHVYCRYCFRRAFEPGEGTDPKPEEWRRALDWVRGSGAHAVILSGGDPLAVRDARLLDTIDALRPAIPVVRIHTRAPITRPARVTPELAQALAARAPVFVLVHANHPRELSAEVDAALGHLVDAGVPVLNQAVLLRGVNDDVEVLEALSRALVERRVVPTYLHHPDAVTGNAHFRVSMEEGLALHRALGRRVGGFLLPRYVIDPPDGTGKVAVAEWVARARSRAPS